MGVLNLCALRWGDTDCEYKELANKVKVFIMEEDCVPLVSDFTRVRAVGALISIKAIYIWGWKSDHLGMLLRKSSKEARPTARTTKKRVYKKFDKEAFKADITKANLDGKFTVVLNASDPDEAYEVFECVYGNILDKLAPK